MVFLSIAESPRNHSRTGSLPVSVLKKRTSKVGWLMPRAYQFWFAVANHLLATCYFRLPIQGNTKQVVTPAKAGVQSIEKGKQPIRDADARKTLDSGLRRNDELRLVQCFPKSPPQLL
jgi:hypothetical protein